MTFNIGLDRKGPGLLVRDLLRSDPVTLRSIQRVAQAKPDIAVLQKVDYDRDLLAVGLIQSALLDQGLNLPHRFVGVPNTGLDTGVDLDKNGRLGEPRDMQGYGQFAGQGGMVVLSRYPIIAAQSVDMSAVLWADQPEPELPQLDGKNFFDAKALSVLRLHSVAAWDVAVQTDNGLLRVLAAHASTPVFDGPEDRNGLRNAAELRFWLRYIETLQAPFVLVGDLNSDEHSGEGLKPALLGLLDNPRLFDPKPAYQGNLQTAAWENGLSLRVSYVLPSRHFGSAAAKVEWAPFLEGGSRHHPVWVDLVWK